MKIADIFKRKQDAFPEKDKKKKTEKIVSDERLVKAKNRKVVSKSKKPVETKKISEISGTAWRVLRPPHITEKATRLSEQKQYVFKVSPEANKIEIKKAIQDIYKVNVLAVRIINIPPKKRRLGKTTGWKQGYKKAIVKIKKDQKIELLPR